MVRSRASLFMSVLTRLTLRQIALAFDLMDQPAGEVVELPIGRVSEKPALSFVSQLETCLPFTQVVSRKCLASGWDVTPILHSPWRGDVAALLNLLVGFFGIVSRADPAVWTPSHNLASIVAVRDIVPHLIPIPLPIPRLRFYADAAEKQKDCNSWKREEGPGRQDG